MPGEQDVFTRPECLFNYCPDPQGCQAQGACQNPDPKGIDGAGCSVPAEEHSVKAEPTQPRRRRDDRPIPPTQRIRIEGQPGDIQIFVNDRLLQDCFYAELIMDAKDEIPYLNIQLYGMDVTVNGAAVIGQETRMLEEPVPPAPDTPPVVRQSGQTFPADAIRPSSRTDGPQ